MEAVILEEKPEAGVVLVSGREYMHDAKGHLVPVVNIKAEDKLEDEMVRKIISYAKSLSDQVTRFREHTMADIGDFDQLLAQEYGATIGGKKGNKTYYTFDGLMMVKVQVSDLTVFGPQLQIAKSLIDECLNEWSADSRPEIQAIVTLAFNTDKEGQINKAGLYTLLRLDISDARWNRAMDAIRASMRITGSKEYVRFYTRETIEDGWTAVTIDLAKT
jgi:Protein of unknown function (DUF3164)